MGSRKKHSLSPKQQKEYIRYSFADICVKSSWNRVSPYRFLNRALFMVQRPICFAIFRRKKNGALKKSLFSVSDPLFEKTFKKHIDDFLGPDGKIDRDIESKYLFQIFDIDLYMIIFAVKRARHGCCRKQSIKYRLLDKSNPIGKYFDYILEDFGGSLESIGIRGHLTKNMEESTTNRPIRKQNIIIPTEPQTADVLSESHDEILKLVEDAYVRSKNSPILSINGRMPSNIIIYCRSFNRDNKRFGAYLYDCYPVFGKTQRADLREALERCQKSPPRKGGRWAYNPSDIIGSKAEIKPKFPNTEADMAFWQLIERGQFDEILDIASEPSLPMGVRLFVEYVFTSGVSQINHRTFCNGDVGWIDPSSFSSDLKLRAAELRLACLHYLHVISAPKVKYPSILSLPIRVAGANWLVATTIRTVSSARTVSSLIDGEQFEKSYLFYHSLMRPMEERLRRKSKIVYLNHASSILRYFLLGRCEDRKGEGVFDSTSFFKELNSATKDLARAYPYDVIEYSCRSRNPKADKDKMVLDLNFERTGLLFELIPNIWFDRADAQEPYLRGGQVRDHLYVEVKEHLEKLSCATKPQGLSLV